MQDTELPGYTNRASATVTPQATLGALGRHEHVYSLERKGKKWLNLFVKSRTASPTPPLFLEGDTISGRVEVDVEKAEGAKAITIAVQAGTTAVGQEELLFLDLTETLWPTPGSNKAQLQGKHSWPFTFTVPAKVLVSEKQGTSSMHRLPPNFSERASPAYIDYRFLLTVKRGALRVNHTLSPYFVFMPSTVAESPSALRQLAYREGSSVMGPDIDPEGWKVLPFTIKGKLFNARDIEVGCTLAIASPLSYAIKSPVPLMMTFTSTDSQALDILATHSAIRLFLVRSMATGSDAADENGDRRSNNFFKEGVTQAFFWPSGEGVEGTRTLKGEMDLKPSLKPSFDFPRLTIRYSLDLLTFEAPGFVQSIEDKSGSPTVLSEKVVITTRQTPGVTPRSDAPPGYEKPQGGDYNKSMGLLENGNQRFYPSGHHR